METVARYVSVGTVTFRVLRYQGGTDSAPLVLFHGFTGSAAVWHELAEAWSPDRTVFAVDLPGHGGTFCTATLSWEEHIEALAALVGRLSDIPVHLLGYSMGARLALGVAASGIVPLQSLTLESVHPGLRTELEIKLRRKKDRIWIDLLRAHPIETFAATWENLPLWRHQETSSPRAGLHRSIRRSQRPDGLSASLQSVGLGEQPSLWDSLSALAFPVHLIAGGEDTRFARLAEEAHRSVPHGCMTLFPDCGHSVNVEDPDAYLAITKTFFQHSDSSGHFAESHSEIFRPFTCL